LLGPAAATQDDEVMAEVGADSDYRFIDKKNNKGELKRNTKFLFS